jgi:hypothetical protein
MAAVGEKDMIRLLIEPIPTDLQALFLEDFELLLFRAFRDRVFMTFQAGFDARHAGEVLGLKIGVAGFAFQPLPDMELVVERNRLLNLRARPNIEEKKKYDDPDGKSSEEFHGS